MTSDAEAMQRQALHMYGLTEYSDRALIQLDQARCMVIQGDVASACQYATQTIAEVPIGYQGLVKQYGREFLDQLPAATQTETPVRELRELLDA